MQLPPQVNGILSPPYTEEPSSLDFEATSGTPLGPEPWYYGFLSGYAKMAMGLGIAVTLLGSVLIIFAMMSWGFLGHERPTPGEITRLCLVAIVWLLGLVSVLLGILFQVALILLVVDMGRNLRKIRQNTQY